MTFIYGNVKEGGQGDFFDTKGGRGVFIEIEKGAKTFFGEKKGGLRVFFLEEKRGLRLFLQFLKSLKPGPDTLKFLVRPLLYFLYVFRTRSSP